MIATVYVNEIETPSLEKMDARLLKSIEPRVLAKWK